MLLVVMMSATAFTLLAFLALLSFLTLAGTRAFRLFLVIFHSSAILVCLQLSKLRSWRRLSESTLAQFCLLCSDDWLDVRFVGLELDWHVLQRVEDLTVEFGDVGLIWSSLLLFAN